MEEIKEATRQDPVLQLVIASLVSGRWISPATPCDEDVISSLNKFSKVEDDLSVTDELVLRGSRIVIPASLQEKVVQLAHEGHQGIYKTKALLRSKGWFPKLDNMCEDAVKNCFQCHVAPDTETSEPLCMTLPNEPCMGICQY